MAKFSYYKPMLTAFEGGYVDDPDDLGGATNMGITYRTYCAYMRNKGLLPTMDKFKTMSVETRDDIIIEMYWNECRADEINNQSIAIAIVDWYVNSGVNATIAVQRILKVKVDGKVGPVTIGAINSANQKELFNAIKQARIDFINRIVAERPKNAKFKKGWINRVNQIKFAE